MSRCPGANSGQHGSCISMDCCSHIRDLALVVQPELLLRISPDLLQLAVQTIERKRSAVWEATSAERADLTVRCRLPRAFLCSLVEKNACSRDSRSDCQHLLCQGKVGSLMQSKTLG